jgi:hypothetical protein
MPLLHLPYYTRYEIEEGGKSCHSAAVQTHSWVRSILCYMAKQSV